MGDSDRRSWIGDVKSLVGKRGEMGRVGFLVEGSSGKEEEAATACLDVVRFIRLSGSMGKRLRDSWSVTAKIPLVPRVVPRVFPRWTDRRQDHGSRRNELATTVLIVGSVHGLARDITKKREV